MQIGDRIEVLRDDGLPARVIFDKVPRNAAPAPDPVGHASMPTAAAAGRSP